MPDYRALVRGKQPSKPQSQVDYRTLVGPSRTPVDMPVQQLPDSLSARSVSEARLGATKALSQMGYSQQTIDSLTVPPAAPPDSVDAFLSPVAPLPEQDLAVLNETTKVVQQLNSEGVTLDRRDIERLTAAVANVASTGTVKGIAGMAAGRQWLSNLYRSTGEKATGYVGSTMIDVSAGMALLDWANWLYKKYKIDGFKIGGWQVVPPGYRVPLRIPGTSVSTHIEMPGIADDAERAAMELRCLPKFTLKYRSGAETENPQEFGSSTAAAFYLVTQRALGRGEKVLGKLTGNKAMAERGKARTEFTTTAIPPFVASLGDYPLWQDIEEANMTAEEVQNRYKWINDHGTAGQAAALAASFGTAISDAVGDPTLVLGAIPGQLALLGRSVLRTTKPIEYATGLTQVARRTARLEDAAAAYGATKRNYESAVAKAAERYAESGEHADVETMQRIIVTRRAHAVNREWMGRFEPPGPHEHIMLRTAKRHPDALPEQPAVRPSPAEIRTTESAYKLAYRDALRVYQEELEKHGGEITQSMILSPGDLRAGNTLTQTTNTARLELYHHPKKPAYVVTKKGPTPGSLKDEFTRVFPIAKYKRAATTEAAQPVVGYEPNQVNPDVLADLSVARRRALMRDYDGALEWDVNSNEFRHRQLLGPDGAEEAGDGLNLMARTGGTGMDDIAVHEVFPEYNTSSPATGLSHINWTQIDRVNELTAAEREAKKIPWTKGKEIGMYPLRALQRERGVLGQAAGAARRAGDRKAFRLYMRKINATDKAIDKVEKNLGAVVTSMAEYDPSWLPGAIPGVTHTPARYNNWLKISDGRVVRSLVPGGLRLDRYWTTPMGQVHSLLREPMRFFQNYYPEGWNMLHGSYLDYNESLDAWNNRVYEILERAEVVTKKAKFDPRKHWAPFDVNTERRDLLFDMLDTDPNRQPDLQWEAALDPEFDHVGYMSRGDDKLAAAHDEIRKLLDHAAELQGITDTPKYLTNYMRHVITSDQFANGYRPLEYIGLPVNAEVFVSHLLERTGNQPYSKDLLMALDFYGRAMNRKLHLEPAFERMSKEIGPLLHKRYGNSALQSYCSDLVMELKGRPSYLGAKVDNAIAAPVNTMVSSIPKAVRDRIGLKGWTGYQPGGAERILMGLNNLAYAGMIVGNPRYAVMQMATGVTTSVSRFGLFRTMRGLLEYATPEGQALNKAIGTYKPFKDVFEDPTYRRFVQALTDKGVAVTPLGPMSNGMAEEFIRGVSGMAAVDLILNRFGMHSWDEAVEAGLSKTIAMRALQMSQEVNHMYGPLGRSPVIARTFGRGGASFATQFMSFTWKQTDELLSQFATDPGRIAQYLAVCGYVSRVAAQSAGMDLTDYVGFGYLPKKTEDLASPGVDAFMSMIGFLSAVNSRDPERIDKAGQEMMRNIVGYAPLSQATQSAMKAAERLSTAELRTATGEVIRPMDYAQTLSKQEGQHWLARVAELYRPTETPSKQALGGEFVATMFSQRNIKEALTRKANEAIRQETRKFHYNRVKAIENLVRALDGKDQAAIDEATKVLLDPYKVRIDDPNPVVRQIKARALLQRIKLISPDWGGDPMLFDRYLEIMNNYGVGLEE